MRMLYALAINRADFLTGREKLVLAEIVDSETFLTSLTIDDLSQIVGRVLNTRLWDPVRYLELARRDARYIERSGIKTVVMSDSRYPAQLRAIYDPPFLLHVRGDLPRWDVPAVAIVGTRNPTEVAVAATLRLAHECAAAGIPVVSGLARGIDGAAHQGALRGAGVTLAVLGSGIDVIYPQSHRSLAARILDHGGAILSEYPPDSEPTRYRFPERNRVISGLCRSVVIAQAPEKSGALLTADYALEQGRDLYVLREGLEGETGAGGRNLRREGSVVVAAVEDIVGDWLGVSAVVSDGGHRVVGLPATTGPTHAGRQLALKLEQELQQIGPQLPSHVTPPARDLGEQEQQEQTEIREARLH